MALTTYSGLLSGLAAFSVRSDQTALWPLCVELAEAQFNRDLADKAVRPMIARATTTVDEEFESVPDDMIRPVSFVLTVDDRTVHLQHVAPENMARMKQTPDAYTLEECGSEIDAPGWYAVVGQEFQFFPAPETGRTGELTYVQRIPALSADNPSNWLSEAHPDAYLYGALVQFGAMAEDERLPVWKGLYDAALAGVLRAYPTETNKAALRTELVFPRYC